MGDPLIGVLGVVGFIAAYFLPLIIGGIRKHRSILAIGFLNLILGWTVLGWLIAMVWSLTGNVREEAPAKR